MGAHALETAEDPSNARLLTVSETCARLRISRWMLYELMRTRQLETVKIGRRRLVPASAIIKLVDGLLSEQRNA